MRYLTKATLNARLESSREVVIYVPPHELIETTPQQEAVTIRFVWRGQSLNADAADIRSIAVPQN